MNASRSSALRRGRLNFTSEEGFSRKVVSAETCNFPSLPLVFNLNDRLVLFWTFTRIDESNSFKKGTFLPTLLGPADFFQSCLAGRLGPLCNGSGERMYTPVARARSTRKYEMEALSRLVSRTRSLV